MSTVRYCPNCGAQTPASERFCAGCGTRMPDATPTPPPTQPVAPPPTLPMPGSAPAPARRGMPRWLAILLVVIGVGLVGCVAAIGGLAWLGGQLGSPTAPAGPGAGGILPTVGAVRSATPGATAAPAPTRAPTSAPTAAGGIVGGATGGGVASVAQTAQARTAQAVGPTQTAAAALAAEAEVAALLQGARQIFSDDFVDNRNRWFTGVFQEIELDQIEDGVFKVIWSGRGTSYELYEVREVTNFIAEVDCLVVSGGADGSCSLVFGQRNDVGFYKFELFEDYYRLFIVSDGDPLLLVEGDPAGIVGVSEVNRLRAIRQGDRIRIFLNGQLLGDLIDRTYPTGRIGLSTNSYLDAGGVEVHFDNFAIWELP